MTDVSERLAAALADRYTIERELGAGGMATVYLAHDLQHERKVAVKVLRPELAAALGQDRFLKEVKIAANLTHPHVLPLHASGEVEGLLYYVMPFIDGESLRDKLKREGELPVADTVRILREIVDALDYAHKQGVVHRDIKPDNVLMSERHALVTDFGVAKAVSEATDAHVLTGEGVALGTPAYMAPEQAAADPSVDHRADIYAVGAMAYEMLTGRPPFVGATPQVVLAAHVTQAAESVTIHRDTVPPDLEQLVMKCLEKKPADRWQSAEQLLIQLDNLAGRADAGTQQELPQPTTAFRRHLSKTALISGIVAAAALVVGGLRLMLRGGDGAEPTPADPVRIAVLPLENLAQSDEDDFLSEGITQDINTQLSKLGGFIVIAHGSARLISQARMTIPEAAVQLGVRYLVTGSVSRAGDRVRVTARLVDGESEAQIWADEFDRTYSAEQVFAVRSDISRAVANALSVTLSPSDEQRFSGSTTDNTAAYDAYQLGRFFWNKRTGEDMMRAIEHFQTAAENDTTYARAFAGLAESYVLLPFFQAVSQHEALARARDFAQHALALDPTLPEPYAVMGLIHQVNFEWAEAALNYRRAIELNPSYATAHQWYGDYLGFRGRLQEALSEVRFARALDPLSYIVSLELGLILYVSRSYDEAIEQFRATVSLDPTNPYARSMLGLTYLQSGDSEAALTELERAVELSPDRWPFALGNLAYGYGVLGRTAEARRLVSELEERAGREPIRPVSVAYAYLGVGQLQRALDWLEMAVNEKDVWLTIGGVRSPEFDALQDEPRFAALLGRMNLDSDH